jgi:hypothetical protein
MEFVLTHPDEGLKNITVLFDGVPYVADSDHPWWDEIIDFVLDDDPRVLDLFPIRSVQQPSTEAEPDEEAVFTALNDFFEERGIDPFTRAPEDYSNEELGSLRTLFDRLGAGACPDPDCLFCYGPRS